MNVQDKRKTSIMCVREKERAEERRPAVSGGDVYSARHKQEWEERRTVWQLEDRT